MLQLTKPENFEGERIVNVQLTANDVKYIHEALVAKVHVARHTEEASVQAMTQLREEFNKIRILMNPS